MFGLLDSDEKRAIKNRKKVENQLNNLKKRLEKFKVTNQSDQEKLEIFAIVAEIEELNAMIGID